MKKEKVLGLLTIVLVMTMSMIFGSLQAEAYTYKVTGKGKNTTHTIYITKGEKTSLKLNYRKSAGKKYSTKNVTWKVTKGSSKSKILKSKNSKKIVKSKKAKTVYIKGLKKGTATIQTTYKGKKYTTKIVVESGLKLDKTSLEMSVGENETLRMVNTKRTPTWSVKSGKEIVSVDNAGKVTALKEGTATVQAKVGSKNYSCKITVKEEENEDFPYTVAWSMVEEGLFDSTNSPWYAYSNEKTTLVRSSVNYECKKDLSVSGIFPASEKNKWTSIDKLNDFIEDCTITSSNPNVATVELITGYVNFNTTGKTMGASLTQKSIHSVVATVNVIGVGTTTITLKTPKQTLTFEITGLKNLLDLRDEQIAEFKSKYITSGMSDYDKICKLREYVIANYKKATYFDNQNPVGHEGEILYMYSCINNGENGSLIYYSKEGSCTVFASMVGDYCHALGIECYGYYDANMNHEWNYLKLDGNWYKVDMSTSPIIALPQMVSSVPSDANVYTGWIENK